MPFATRLGCASAGLRRRLIASARRSSRGRKTMAHEEAKRAGPARLLIRNIGLVLSGDLARPILEADAILAVDGTIAAIGKAKEIDAAGATVIDANGVAVAPGL